MAELICFCFGVAVGVIYEKQLRKHKEKIKAAVDAAKAVYKKD